MKLHWLYAHFKNFELALFDWGYWISKSIELCLNLVVERFEFRKNESIQMGGRTDQPNWTDFFSSVGDSIPSESTIQ